MAATHLGDRGLWCIDKVVCYVSWNLNPRKVMAWIDAYSTAVPPQYLDEDEPIGVDPRHLRPHGDYLLTDDPVSLSPYLSGLLSNLHSAVEHDQEDTPFRPPSGDAESSVFLSSGDVFELTHGVSFPLEGAGPYSHEPINILRDDQAFIALQPDEINTMLHSRVSFVLCVLRQVFTRICRESRSCPWVKDLWLRMIEDSDPATDIWLWQDGDEEWITCRGNWTSDSVWKSGKWCTGEGIKEDLLDAQLALRRRLEQRKFPEPTLEIQRRNSRIREAYPAQRIAAITWLIITSKHKTETEYYHGRSVASVLHLDRDVKTWWDVIGKSRFPKDSRQSAAWKKTKKERADTKCDCTSRQSSSSPCIWEEWYAMVVWFQPVLHFYWKDAAFFSSGGCDGCSTRAAPIYEQIYGPRARHRSDLPPGSTFIFYILKWCREDPVGVREKDVSFARAVLAKILSPAVTSKFDETWTSLPALDSRRLSMFAADDKYRFAPWVYQYPRDLWKRVASHACSIWPYPTSNTRAPESTEDESAYLAALPRGFADDAPSLMVILGTFIWILACYSPGPSGWHVLWLQLMGEPLKVLSVPTPQGPAVGLYDRLCRRRHDAEGSRSIQVNRTRFWKAYTAILVYVKSKRLGPKFQGCPTCHAMYSHAFSNPPRQGPRDPDTDIEHPGPGEQRRSSPAPDSEHADTELLVESPATSSRVGRGIDFRSTILDDSLSLDERQRIFEQQLQNLANFATSHGLHLPDGLIHAVSPLNSRECPETRSANGMAPRRGPLPRQIGNIDDAAGHSSDTSSTYRGSNPPSMPPSSSTPNTGQGKKTEIIKESKERLVSMLGEIGFTIPKNRLPWSTLGEELKEFGYMILNWPDGVVRENERGMHGLNIQQANRLRHALTRQDDARLQFVRCMTGATESVVGNESITSEPRPGTSNSKRARGGAGGGRSAKKARFRVTTAEEYAEVVNDV